MPQWRKRFFCGNAFCQGFLLFPRTRDGLAAAERRILIGNITELYLKDGKFFSLPLLIRKYIKMNRTKIQKSTEKKIKYEQKKKYKNV